MLVLKKQPYAFLPSDTGIFIEIYLPKKSKFQGVLYDTLAKGFKIKEVKSHFRDNQKKPGIRELLGNYDSIKDYSDEMIENFPSVFYGYSMYEVDGVFYSSESKIQEERTQVIRIIFRPDLQTFSSKYPGKEGLTRHTTRDFLSYSPKDEYEKNKKLDRLQIELIYYLREWIDYVGLFLFGYVIFELCSKITYLLNVRSF